MTELVTRVRKPVDVNPTSTSLAILDVRATRTVSLAVKHSAAGQTLTVWTRLRLSPLDDFADGAQREELLDIPTDTPRLVVLEVSDAAYELEVMGRASGGGLTCNLTVEPDRRGR